MDITFFAQYQGFEFHCSPTRMPGGGFIPRLLVSADCGATQVDIPLPALPHGLCFADASAAAHRSFSQGRCWVDTGHGDPASTSPALRYVSEPEPG